MADSTINPNINPNPESLPQTNPAQNTPPDTGNAQVQTPQPSNPLESATSNPTEQPKSKWSLFKTRKFIVVLVLIALVLGSTVIGIFFFAQNNKAQEPKKAEPTSATLGWKTYEDQSLAFSVKYPPNWIYNNLEPKWSEPGITNKITFTSTNPAIAADKITLYRFLWKFSLNTFVQTEINQGLQIPEKGEPFTIGGQEARQFNKALVGSDNYVSPGFQALTTLVKRGDDMFVFETIYKSEETKNIYDEMLKTAVFGQKKEDAQQTDVKLTSIYTNPTFGYSIKIPDGWKEAQSDDEQKRFHFYIEKQSNGSSDELGFFKAEIQILTLAYNNPAVSGNLEDINKLKALKVGEELIIRGGMVAKKIKDFNIDGRDAIYLMGKADDFTLSVSIMGEKRYISIILKGDDQETLDKHRAEFEAAVDTFKFNSFSLD